MSVWYYWMDGRQLRRGECKNYRACVDYWWACMEAEGLTDYVTGQSDDDRQQVAANQVLLVLAESYMHVCASKGQRSVFFDAIPRWSHRRRTQRSGPMGIAAHCTFEDMIVLDPEEDQQLRAIAENRNVEAVRAEVRDALVGELPPREEMPAFDRAFQEWMQNAICALQTGGHDGLRLFLRDRLV